MVDGDGIECVEGCVNVDGDWIECVYVASMVVGSDGRTQQSNLMVVGKIGGGTRWFGWLQNRG
jgi:hypothetical protein